MNSWRRLIYYFGMVLGGLLFAYQFWVGHQAFLLNSHFISLPIFIAAIGLAAFVNSLQIGVWYYLMKGLGVFIPWRQLIRGYMLSSLARYIPGGVWGYFSRNQWLYQSYAVPFNLSNTGSVLEALCLVTAAVTIIGIYWVSVLSGWLQWVLFVFVISFPLALWGVIHILPNWSFPGWVLEIVSMRDALKVSLVRWLMIIALYVVLWTGFGGVLFWAIGALDASAKVSLLDSTFVFAAAWLTGFLIVFVPAGFGIRELALSGLLITRFGMLYGPANALSVSIRFIISLAELVSLLAGLVLNKSLPLPEQSSS